MEGRGLNLRTKGRFMNLIDELTLIDALILTGDATDDQEAKGQKLVTLANAAPDLLETLKRLAYEAESRRVPKRFVIAAKEAIAKAEAL